MATRARHEAVITDMDAQLPCVTRLYFFGQSWCLEPEYVQHPLHGLQTATPLSDDALSPTAEGLKGWFTMFMLTSASLLNNFNAYLISPLS